MAGGLLPGVGKGPQLPDLTSPQGFPTSAPPLQNQPKQTHAALRAPKAGHPWLSPPPDPAWGGVPGQGGRWWLPPTHLYGLHGADHHHGLSHAGAQPADEAPRAVQPPLLVSHLVAEELEHPEPAKERPCHPPGAWPGGLHPPALGLSPGAATHPEKGPSLSGKAPGFGKVPLGTPRANPPPRFVAARGPPSNSPHAMGDTYLTAALGMEPYTNELSPRYSPRTPWSRTVCFTQSPTAEQRGHRRHPPRRGPPCHPAKPHSSPQLQPGSIGDSESGRRVGAGHRAHAHRCPCSGEGLPSHPAAAASSRTRWGM